MSSNMDLYRRVENTTVSGSALHSSLSGENMRLLQFDAALKQPAAVNVVGTTVSLGPNQLIQASISSLNLLGSTAAGNDGIVSLGADTASNAASYINFFNITSTTDVRMLRFVSSNTLSATTEITLANSSGTSANVKVLLNGAAASATQNLFVGANAVGTALSGVAGAERIVLVSASNLTAGSQVVNFNVLGNSL
jgi:hypothetical protein